VSVGSVPHQTQVLRQLHGAVSCSEGQRPRSYCGRRATRPVSRAGTERRHSETASLPIQRRRPRPARPGTVAGGRPLAVAGNPGARFRVTGPDPGSVASDGDRNAEPSNSTKSFADHHVSGDPPCSSPRRRATSTVASRDSPAVPVSASGTHGNTWVSIRLENKAAETDGAP
jgi:hypothetical protein